MMLKPKIFFAFSEVKSGMSTRLGGVSREPYNMNCSYRVGDAETDVAKNRKTFFTNLDIPADRIAFPQQEHTDIVKSVDTPDEYAHCDALITGVPNLFLSILVADCLPILLYDAQKKIAAAIHAGWRGIASGIVHKTIRCMNEEWRSLPSAIHVFVGPSAGECCYEIGPETAHHFKESILKERNRRLYLNLKEGVRLQLLDEGVRPMNIEIQPECTICNTMFHSYRRDGNRSGRMIAVIGREN